MKWGWQAIRGAELQGTNWGLVGEMGGGWGPWGLGTKEARDGMSPGCHTQLMSH